MASVHQDGGFICSGTVISQRWVLTAGHCIGAGRYDVRVGSVNRSSGGRFIHVDLALLHPQASQSPFSNDVGLLRLDQDAGVPTVALSGPGDDNLEADGAPATLVGWGDITPTLGLLAPESLRRANVNIVNDLNCYGEDASIGPRTNVCDSGLLQGQCNGDSGGAQLAPKNGGVVQIGVISNSLNILCGYGNLIVPEASAEVNAPSIRDWIRGWTGV
jgi:snapalysin